MAYPVACRGQMSVYQQARRAVREKGRMPKLSSGVEGPDTPLNLSQREAQIAQCIAQGYSNAAIAQKLGIRTATVAAHVSSAKIKLRARNRAQLASVFTLACARRGSAVLLLLSRGPQDAN
jgi:DNA-binding NarL/FixJ family response regulator